jgi:regulator of ribonuclease activity B
VTTDVWFYGPTAEALAALADDLIHLGFIVPEPARPAEDGGWIYEVYALVSILDPQFRSFEESAIKAAQRHGCEWDGHGTYVGPLDKLTGSDSDDA